MERCARRDGCPWDKDRPRLSRLDAAAWFVFQSCSTQWDVVAGLGGGGRTGLKYDRARIVAEANGWALNGPLLSRIQRLESLAIMDDNRKREETTAEDGSVN